MNIISFRQLAFDTCVSGSSVTYCKTCDYSMYIKGLSHEILYRAENTEEENNCYLVFQ
jgi:hypothetical protein